MRTSAFFSYNACPLRASTIMTERAPVIGTPPDVRGTAGARELAVAEAAFFARVRVILGVSSLSADGIGTPAGRMPCGCNVWPMALQATAMPQRRKVQLRAIFMGAKLAIKFSSAQAGH